MEDIIMQEAAVFKDDISKMSESGAPVAVPKLFLEMVNCVLWRIISGRAVDAGVRRELATNVRESLEMGEGRPLQVLQVRCSHAGSKDLCRTRWHSENKMKFSFFTMSDVCEVDMHTVCFIMAAVIFLYHKPLKFS